MKTLPTNHTALNLLTEAKTAFNLHAPLNYPRFPLNPSARYTVTMSGAQIEAVRAAVDAAPELLDALQDALAELKDVVMADGGDDSPAMVKARAAIAKAPGAR